jgi:hypothetical protein
MKAYFKFASILFLSFSSLFYIHTNLYSQPFSIGQKYRGGIIFYLDSTGSHGLIAATSDQGKTLGRMGRLSGKGEVSKPKLDPFGHSTSQENLDDATIARRVCSYYTTTVKNVTYHTWYLPSSRELNLLYSQKSVVGGFKDDLYWSSTWNERFEGFMLLNFSNGNLGTIARYCVGYIRPVQDF